VVALFPLLLPPHRTLNAAATTTAAKTNFLSIARCFISFTFGWKRPIFSPFHVEPPGFERERRAGPSARAA
jgi:hypothetical protein